MTALQRLLCNLAFGLATLAWLGGCKPSTDDGAAPTPNVTTPEVSLGEETKPTETTPPATAEKPAEMKPAEKPAPAETTSTDKKAFDMSDVPLIPRRKFFGNPEKARARLSPDGTKLAYLAPVDGVLNVWVGTTESLGKDAKPITKDTHRGIRSFSWSFTNNHVLYTQDKDGDENFHVYAVNLTTDEIKDLTPLENIRAEIDNVSENFPNEILIGLNDRNPQLHDLYRLNVETGEKELLQENPGFAGFLTDDNYKVRFAMTYTPDAGQMYLTPTETDGKEDWKPFLKIDAADAMTTGIAGFDKSGDIAYMYDSRDRNTAALKSLDLKTGEEKLIAENDKADISGILAHPTEKTIQAVAFNYERQTWDILDKSLEADFAFLKEQEDGEIQITSRTLKDDLWTVAYIRDDGPIDFYLYHRGEQPKAEFLFSSQPELAELPLVKMHPVVIDARDNLKLVSYLSLPKGSNPDGGIKPTQPLPLVLDVHGGPWARDDWGFNSMHQLLANRGYAVLSVNYRGSTGFGKEFLNAANKEWAGKMHDDLLDAVDWAVAEGIADPDKIAIMGGSYGGYATLVGLTFTPDKFCCGVDIVGPSSLVTLLNNVPPYWMPFMPVMKDRVGDHETEEGMKFLNERSPLNFVDKINKPLLIGQGANDPRVKQAEADQIVKAMEEKKIPVTYVLFPEEGHGFAKPENRFAFNAITEAFLAENLGGRYEPIGDAFVGAKLEIPAGAADVPGVKAALEK
ncbi:S9 family peptidase [Blastopirellula marina]|uniref:S9 family peptidase n=1 Tax=Blastopirellula marina TaxID=124 RepID=A0A2S8FWI5_9BACT|nr:S9 family peptidase [Blastopirellula marina]PQO36529.1 S9 family peptidase [Blastopirellula marina]PTL44368.1 S9 family peptidase [Blastopirellula marina]